MDGRMDEPINPNQEKDLVAVAGYQNIAKEFKIK